jgi:O-antigen/teichoic acid export membrane protein
VFLVSYKAIADLAGKGVMFVITIVAARRLTPQAFGTFALASTLGWMLAIAADWGIQLHVARAVARAPKAAAAVLDAWLRVRLWTTAGAIAVVMLALIAMQASVAFAMPMLLFALVYGGSGLIEFLHYYYRGLSRSDIESSLTLWQRGATLLCGIAALMWRPNVSVLALAMLVPVAATLTMSLRIARRVGASASRTTPDSRLPTPDHFWTDVFPIGAAAVLSALYFRIDVFLVQWWSGTEAVALYNAVFRLVEALRLFPAAVLAVMLPALVRATSPRPLMRISAGVVAFAVAATIVLWMGADIIVPLVYGPSYTAAVTTFRILMLAFPLLSVNYALTHQLVGWNGQRAYAAICALALVVNVALNARLIPALAIEGAAWATLGTEIFLTIACTYAIVKARARHVERDNAGVLTAESANPNSEPDLVGSPV